MQVAVRVVVVGALDLVAQAIVELLHERKFPFAQLTLLDTDEAVGEVVEVGHHHYIVEDLADFDFTQADIAFFAAGEAITLQYAAEAQANGCLVIDESAALRQQDNACLLVPALNARHWQATQHAYISSPSCVSLMLAHIWLAIGGVAAWQHISVTALHAVSALGKRAVEVLAHETGALFNQQDLPDNLFGARLAFNVLPQIGALHANGASHEEWKIQQELSRLLGKTLPLSVTSIRVPLFFGHAVQLHLQATQAIDLDAVLTGVAQNPMLSVVADPDILNEATPATIVGAEVIRIARLHKTADNQLSLWVISDNIRVGAALNCVNCAEWWLNQQMNAQNLH